MKERFGVILMKFERERPARWAVHIARGLLEADPQPRPGCARRWTLQVAVDFYGDMVKPVVLTSGDGFFHRLCFAYALRYPHVPFRMQTAYEDDEGVYFESTHALYQDKTVRFTQIVRHRGQFGERYESRWADWAVEGGVFRLSDHGVQESKPV